MPTRAKGPLQADYTRAIRAAKKAGAPAVEVIIGGATIVIPLTGDYLSRLASAQLPAPSGRQPKLLW